MIGQILKFEDFAAPSGNSRPTYNAADLEAAFERGRQNGREAGRDAAVLALTAALDGAVQQAANADAIKRAATDEAIKALAPMLREVVAKLADAGRLRIADAVLAELHILCLAGLSPVCRISGPVEQLRVLTDRVEAAGLENVRLLPGAETEIVFDGGRIAIDSAFLPDQILEMLAELTDNKEISDGI